MSETLQLEEPVRRNDDLEAAPKLLVEWSSPWREFVGSIGPALARSERRLAGEAPFGLVPLRIMIPSCLLEAFLIFAAIVIQVGLAGYGAFDAIHKAKTAPIKLKALEDSFGAHAVFGYLVVLVMLLLFMVAS